MLKSYFVDTRQKGMLGGHLSIIIIMTKTMKFTFIALYPNPVYKLLALYK